MSSSPFRPLQSPRLADVDAERARRSHEEAIEEIRRSPMVSGYWIEGVDLATGVETPIAHKLGRSARTLVSPPRGPAMAGMIEEVRSSSYDRRTHVVLKASGYGATVTVDVWVS